MATKRYDLHLRGISSAQGEIASSDLVRILGALGTLSKRTLSLLTTGKGGIQGPYPKWLSEAAEFCLVGLRSGSTVLSLSARTFRETARQEIQPELFPERPSPSLNDSPLDIVSCAVTEAQVNESTGDYFDATVLKSMRDLLGTVRDEFATLELVSTDGNGKGFELNKSTREQIRRHTLNIPVPVSTILTGTLDEIVHSKHLFLLIQGDGVRISGHLKGTSTQLESLRALWGKRATVQGLVHSRSDGAPRYVEAGRVVEQVDGDVVLSRASLRPVPRHMPKLDSGIVGEDISKPNSLVGTWPGQESIEELMADLH